MDFLSSRGIYVILDATQIQRDWHLAGLEYELLRFLINEAGINAAVPESVFAEVVANHEREWTTAVRQLARLNTSLSRLRGSRVPPAEHGSANYEARLAERIEAMGIERLPYPAVGHAQLVARATSRRPPFDASGSGYRDALTWASCMELAAEGERVFLVSQDNDFSDGKGGLSAVLQHEVASASGSISLVRNFGSWLMTLIPWRDVSDLKEAASVARDEVLASLFAPWDIFESPNFTVSELGLPESAELEEVTYSGSGGSWLERVAHERNADGSHLVSYEFPIEFSATMRLDVDVAVEYGYMSAAGSSSGMTTVETVVPMIGRMTVMFDHSRDDGFPFTYESFDFRPVQPGEAEADAVPVS